LKSYNTLADILDHPDDIALPALDVLGIKIPRTYKEAIPDPQYGSEWMSTVDEENKSLVQNRTWEEHILPKNSQPSFNQMGIYYQDKR
jgi:hypothetical protein